MADDFALGAALTTAGQGLGHMSDTMFAAQIQAANNAQRADLEHQRMQFEQEKATAQEKETARAHDLEHQDRQDTNERQAKYQEGELALRGKEVDYTGQRTAAEVANMGDEMRHRGVQEQQENEKIGIERDKANEASGKGAGAADKAGAEHVQKQITEAEAELKKLNPGDTDVSLLPGDQGKQYKATKAKVDALKGQLAHINAKLSAAGKMNAPLGGGEDPQGIDTEMTDVATGVAPKQEPGKAPKEKVAPKVNVAAIPPGAISLLKGNPSTAIRVQFDQKYGQGAAAQILGE